jgi:hypothetical protein
MLCAVRGCVGPENAHRRRYGAAAFADQRKSRSRASSTTWSPDKTEFTRGPAHYDRCLTVAQEAEGKVSDDEYSYLQRNTSIAFDQMMRFARCLILCRPPTRRGLIHQVRPRLAVQ